SVNDNIVLHCETGFNSGVMVDRCLHSAFCHEIPSEYSGWWIDYFAHSRKIKSIGLCFNGKRVGFWPTFLEKFSSMDKIQLTLYASKDDSSLVFEFYESG